MRLILAALLALSALCAFAGPPEYPVHRAPCPVTLDGEIAGDPAWAAIPAMTGFSALGGGYSHGKQTVAQLCHDDQALYLAVTCEEPDAAALELQVGDGGNTWAEDSLEVFFQPLPNPQVYQLGVTAAGARGGFVGDPDPTGFQAATKIGADQYTVEARFPYTLLKAAAGGTWRGNICRNIFADQSPCDKFTSWAPLRQQFLEPENFAFLVFKPSVLTPADAGKITDQLNSTYREALARLVSQAASSGAQYVETLKEASDDPVYGERARNLARQWRRIDRISRKAQAASILDMRKALMTLQTLNADSYEVKYRYLIHRLLSEAGP